MPDEINYDTKSASGIPNVVLVVDAPAVTSVSEMPKSLFAEDNSTVEWPDLTDSQKLDVIHRKLDALAFAVDGVDKGQSQIWNAVDWTARTINGLAEMAKSLNPGDIFKAMLKGGK